ncbi:hypothetical protein Vretifemale_18703, partial [Volvox reticuliferus]
MYGEVDGCIFGEEPPVAGWTLTGCVSDASTSDHEEDGPADPDQVLAELLRESVVVTSVTGRSKPTTTVRGHAGMELWPIEQGVLASPCSVQSAMPFGERDPDEELSSCFQPHPAGNLGDNITPPSAVLSQERAKPIAERESPPASPDDEASVADNFPLGSASSPAQDAQGTASSASKSIKTLPFGSPGDAPSESGMSGQAEASVSSLPARKSPAIIIPQGLVAARCHALGSGSSVQVSECSNDGTAVAHRQTFVTGRTRLQLVPPSPEAVDAYKKKQQPVGRLEAVRCSLDGGDGTSGADSGPDRSQPSTKVLGLVAAQRLRFDAALRSESTTSAGPGHPSFAAVRKSLRCWPPKGQNDRECGVASTQSGGGGLDSARDSASAVSQNGSECNVGLYDLVREGPASQLAVQQEQTVGPSQSSQVFHALSNALDLRSSGDISAVSGSSNDVAENSGFR